MKKKFLLIAIPAVILLIMFLSVATWAFRGSAGLWPGEFTPATRP